MNNEWQIESVREQFPSLARRVGDHSAVFFDGPAGAQVPISVMEAFSDYFFHRNANEGGLFATSIDNDAAFQGCREHFAAFLGAEDPDCIVFGPNMTSHTFAMSRSLAQGWAPGDEIIVTNLEHDANVTPWRLAAERAGVTVREVELNESDCTLNLDSFHQHLSAKTKLVAVGYASNATGTVNPIKAISKAAHEVGALVYVDAVHFAPHRLIDVKELECDFLVCSAYKFFGPHVGILWGKRELMANLPEDKLRPAPSTMPDRWLHGTANFEGIAGAAKAVDYIANLSGLDEGENTLRQRLTAAFKQIRSYEEGLLLHLLQGLAAIPAIKVWGITDSKRLDERLPTVSFTHQHHTPKELAQGFATEGIFTWSGNHYAVPFTTAMNIEPSGTLRVGLLHYNTIAEVDRLLQTLTTKF